MVSGNQRLERNAQSNRTADPLISPVSNSDFADYLGLVYDPTLDFVLNLQLLAACQWYISHSNNELLSRDYTLRYSRYPEQGDGYHGLGFEPAVLADWIELPVNPSTEVTLVTSDGDDITADSTFYADSKPQRVMLTNKSQQNLVINYKAGYPDAASIPACVTAGILAFASYLYEHRGACDIGDAARKSGALGLWQTEMMILNL